MALKAQRYLVAGYERFLRYQDLSGGFTYWGHGDSDVALTAYAAEFLHHAAHFIPVDDNVIQQAEKWILGQQGTDGAWRGHWDKNDKQATLQTAYVAQMLSVIGEKDEQTSNLRSGRRRRKALAFLFSRANRGHWLIPRLLKVSRSSLAPADRRERRGTPGQ